LVPSQPFQKVGSSLPRLTIAFIALIALSISRAFAIPLGGAVSLPIVITSVISPILLPGLLVRWILRRESQSLSPIEETDADATTTTPPQQRREFSPRRIRLAQSVGTQGPLLCFFIALIWGGSQLAEAIVPPQILGGATALTLTPLLLGWALAWYSRCTVENRSAQVIEPSSITVIRELRPVALIFAIRILLQAITELGWFLPAAREAFANETWASISGSIFLISTLVLLAPHVVRLLHPSRPFPDGHLKERLEQTAASARVKLRRIEIWDTGPRPSFNACVAGALPSQRSVFFTDGLLGILRDEEVDGVFAHELAHGALHHLWIFTGLILGLAGLMVGIEAAIIELQLQNTVPRNGSFELMLLLIFTLFFIRFFGALSRHLESQADLYSAEKTGSPLGIISALQRIGVVTKTIHQKRGWRHPTIPDRIHTVLRCWNDTNARTAFRKRTRRFLSACGAIVLLGTIGWGLSLAHSANSPSWLDDLQRADYLLESVAERDARPWPNHEWSQSQLNRARELIVKAQRAMPSSQSLIPLRGRSYQRLAEIYRRMGEPLNAAAAEYIGARLLFRYGAAKE